MSAPLTEEAADFWFIWTKTGHAPRFAHNTEEAARTEIERLARKCPGKKFILLHATAKFVAPAAVETEAA